MSGEGKLEVFLDGSCPFCRAVQQRVEQFDTDQRLKFVDYNDPAVAARAPFPRARLGQEMHVHAADGFWHVGYFGWMAVLHELPRLAWLGRLLDAPPFRWLGPGIYRWTARHRYRIPGFPAPCHTDSCAILTGVSPPSSTKMRASAK
jgi:predicted DCC family thiol-disulfide oxidoreductase YuxK